MSVESRNMDFSVEPGVYSLKSVVDLEKIDASLFRSKSLWKHPAARGVYGGHIISQALAAASQGVPENQHVHSLHSYFLSQGKDDVPVQYHVEKIRDGRTYCTRYVRAEQSGAGIFTMQASFKQEEQSGTVHQLPIPHVPHQDQLETITEILDRLYGQKCISETNYMFGAGWYNSFPAVIKLVEPEHLLLQKPFYPRRHLWIKARESMDDELHPNMHKCYLAYFTDSFLLQTALLCLAPVSSTSAIFHTSVDHSVWFHAPCRADQWLLYQTETEFLGDGRALCTGRVWDTDGNLVLTAAQEGVMRHSHLSSKL